MTEERRSVSFAQRVIVLTLDDELKNSPTQTVNDQIKSRGLLYAAKLTKPVPMRDQKRTPVYKKLRKAEEDRYTKITKKIDLEMVQALLRDASVPKLLQSRVGKLNQGRSFNVTETPNDLASSATSLRAERIKKRSSTLALEKAKTVQINLFDVYMDLFELTEHMGETVKLLSRFYVSKGDFQSFEEILSVLEEKWLMFKNLDVEFFDIPPGEKRLFLGEENLSDQLDFMQVKVKNSVANAFAEGGSIIDDESYKYYMSSVWPRWNSFTYFFLSPLEALSIIRDRFVELYFRFIDTAMIKALVNEVYVGEEIPYSVADAQDTKADDTQNKESFAETAKRTLSKFDSRKASIKSGSENQKEFFAQKLMDRPTPPSLLLQDIFRQEHGSLFSADRRFSCSHTGLMACKKCPGKLLLLCIRLNLFTSTKFMLDNGISVNVTCDSGPFKRLTYVPFSGHSRVANADTEEEKQKQSSGAEPQELVNERTEREVVKKKKRESRKNSFSERSATEIAREFAMELENAELIEPRAEFHQTTPLAVAVSNAVSGGGLRILDLLLSRSANPLLCSDAGIRAGVGALSRSMNKSGGRISNFGSSIELESDEMTCIHWIYDQVHRLFKNARVNHCTSAWLFQASIDRDWKAVEFLTLRQSDVFETEAEEKLGMDFDAFLLVLETIDHLIQKGLRGEFPTFGIVLYPLQYLLEKFDLYLNTWRMEHIFLIVKRAMKQGLAGDRACVESFLRNSQLLHFLGIKLDSCWEEKDIENSEEFEFDSVIRKKLRLDKNMGWHKGKSVDSIFNLAVKMELNTIVKEFLDLGIDVSSKCRLKALANAVKIQNTGLFEILYKAYGNKSSLMKCFVIALKGKHHESLRKILEFDFSLDFKRKSNHSLPQEHHTRQVLSLFQKILDDVLFERTKFDGDGGKRHRDGFTRKDEETTFFILLKFLLRELDEGYLSTIVRKIVHRSEDEYSKRIWFYGFHDLLVLLCEHGRFSVISESFVAIYTLNYAQWLLFSMEKKRSLKSVGRRGYRNRRARMQRHMLNRKPSRASRQDILDTEFFISHAVPRVERSLSKVLQNKREQETIKKLDEEVKRVKKKIQGEEDFTKARTNTVPRLNRRNGSRNYDYLLCHRVFGDDFSDHEGWV